MSYLFRPLELRSLRLKNRIVVSPMCQYSAQDGFANDWHLVHLGSRAVGGAALVISEATAVSPEGRISPEDLGLWKDAHIEKLKQITGFIQQQGAYAGIQLAHAGRKASTEAPWKGNRQIPAADGGWQPLAPSAIAYRDTDAEPSALDTAGIRNVVADFAAAAGRAVAAGFDVIELHAAHGYLLHQFLSPLSNRREDDYGGSFEHRIRLLLEVTDAVRAEMSSGMPLFVRISGTDWADGGWDIDQSVALAGQLRQHGVDLVDVSSGGLASGVRIPVGPGYQVPLAAQVKMGSGMPTGAVGLITEAAQAEEILQKGQADVVLLARELLRDPYFPLHAASALGLDAPYPPQYERAKPK